MARLFAVVFTLALHVAAFLLLTGQWRPFAPSGVREPAVKAEAQERARQEPDVATVAAVIDWARPPQAASNATSRTAQPARTVVDLEQAREAGRRHADRHIDAIRRLRQRQYGDAIAALLDAPVAQGWPALEQLVREGDGVAAEALLEKAARCDEYPTRRGTYARLADEASRGLDPIAAAYVRAALEGELAHLEREAGECRRAGFGSARLEQLLRERGLEPARGEVRNAAMRQQFAEAFEAHSGPAYAGPFGAALERLHDDALTTDDWITLLAAADDHPAVAYALGFCLLRACDRMPELPPSERARLLRSAANAGNVHAARALAEDLANGGDLGSAYGWMLFARWADANGCNPVATTLDLADTLRGIASLEAVLSSGQRQAGEMLAVSLVAANAAGTRSVWSCPG